MAGKQNEASKERTQDGGGHLKIRLTASGRKELDRIIAEPDPDPKPNAIRLSKAAVDRLPFESAGQRRYYDSELRGFGIRVGKRTKTYFAERSVRGARTGSNSSRVTIGHHGPITADAARQQAMELLAKMANGINPVEEREKEQAVRRDSRRQAERDNISLQNLWDAFQTDRRRTMKESTARGYRNYIESVFSGKKVKRRKFKYENWMDRPIKSITTADVRTLHRLIREESGPAYANGAMRVLSALMGFAESQEWIVKNPVTGDGPPFMRIGVAIRYPAKELCEWMNALGIIRSTGDKSAGPRISPPDDRETIVHRRQPPRGNRNSLIEGVATRER